MKTNTVNINRNPLFLPRIAQIERILAPHDTAIVDDKRISQRLNKHYSDTAYTLLLWRMSILFNI